VVVVARESFTGRVDARDIAPERTFVFGRDDTVFFVALRAVVVLFCCVVVVARAFVAREEEFFTLFVLFDDCRVDTEFVSPRVMTFCVRVAALDKPTQKHNPRKTDSIFLIPFFYFLIIISKIRYFKQGYFTKNRK